MLEPCKQKVLICVLVDELVLIEIPLFFLVEFLYQLGTPSTKHS